MVWHLMLPECASTLSLAFLTCSSTTLALGFSSLLYKAVAPLCAVQQLLHTSWCTALLLTAQMHNKDALVKRSRSSLSLSALREANEYSPAWPNTMNALYHARLE